MAKKDQEPKPLSYFDQRMKLLGITPEINRIGIRQTDLKDTSKEVINELPIFKETDLGIEILVYTIDRLLINFKPENNRWSKNFSITRLQEPVVTKNGDVMKYRIPKGAGTYPFFPPQLIDKFENKIPMKTVFLTEGYFKAFKAAMHGVDIIGLSSITHMKDKTTGALHEDIVKLVKSGLVERFVWLADGDCLDISREITDDKDLRKRPNGFFSSVETFKRLLDDYDTIEKWFFHIDTDSLVQSKKVNRDDVKGLDDLLVTFAGKEDEIVKDLQSVSDGGAFFQKYNVTYATNKVWREFHLGDVNGFYLFHSERRPELKGKTFKFNGTKYRWNEEKNVCEIQMPGEAQLYFRVGDDYYKFIKRPNQLGNVENVFVERKKTTITDDHGKKFVSFIPKYEAFCNVPNHNNYEQVIHNCFNVYSRLDFEPDEDKCTEADCPAIMNLVRHIFGEKTVSYKDKESSNTFECKNYELGLDYLQLLYQNPSQKLPILCLVSRENGTGKSTLGFFLRNMLGANTAIVGNADITGDFNAHWVTKSVVVVDEAKIDKHQAIEKIKMLSTAKKVYMNAKGRGQVELDCFLKFILITNNEETFVTASEDDVRYWVIKVPVLRKDDPRILDKLVEEIPDFLSFLNERKLVSEEKSRMWFHFDLLKTEALKRLIAYSESTIVKELKQGIKDLFLDTGVEEIMMTADVIQRELLPKRYERNYIATVLKDKLRVLPYGVYKVEGLDTEYATEDLALAAAEVKYPDCKGSMAYGKIQRYTKTTRYSYPKVIETMKDGKMVRERVMVSEGSSRPYVFYRRDFVTAEEMANVILDAETKFVAQTTDNGVPAAFTEDPFPPPPAATQQDLNFKK